MYQPVIPDSYSLGPFRVHQSIKTSIWSLWACEISCRQNISIYTCGLVWLMMRNFDEPQNMIYKPPGFWPNAPSQLALSTHLPHYSLGPEEALCRNLCCLTRSSPPGPSGALGRWVLLYFSCHSPFFFFDLPICWYDFCLPVSKGWLCLIIEHCSLGLKVSLPP